MTMTPDRRALAQQRYAEHGPEAQPACAITSRELVLGSLGCPGRGPSRRSRIARPPSGAPRGGRGYVPLDGMLPRSGGEPWCATSSTDARRRSGRSVPSVAVAQPRGVLDDRRRTPAGDRSASSRSPAGSRPSPSAAPAPRSARGSAFFSSSVNSRTFSMAMTAWSAKVFERARSACREGPDLGPPDDDRPRSASLSRSMRHGQDRPRCPSRWRAAALVLGSPRPSTSATWIDSPLEHGPPGRRSSRLESERPRPTSSAPAASPWSRRQRRAARRRTGRCARSSASHSRAAFSAIGSKTGWRSVGELAITRRISLVAVCCSSASVSSRFRVLELREQPHVLDGDDRLVGEGLRGARSACPRRDWTSVRR